MKRVYFTFIFNINLSSAVCCGLNVIMKTTCVGAKTRTLISQRTGSEAGVVARHEAVCALLSHGLIFVVVVVVVK